MAEVQGVETSEQNNSGITKGVVGILSLSVIAAIGVYLSQDKKVTQATPTQESVPTTNTQTNNSQGGTTSVASVSIPTTYKNALYTASGTYASPAGKESVDVTVTVVNDVVEKVNFAGRATHAVSIKWQTEFAKGYEQLVVGKKIDEVSLTIVNGSSLTPKGFMDALTKIKTQAKG